MWIPKSQANLLRLWDDVGIPHRQKKQIFGAPLTIIGILVDPNAMTMTLPPNAKHDLITEIRRFASYHKRKSTYHTKQAWQQLAGWINWGLNVFPLLAPSLCNVYAKLASVPDNPNLRIWCNTDIRADLLWAADHIENSDGVLILHSKAWPAYSADIIIECDACPTGMAFWFPSLQQGYFCATQEDTPTELIFFLEALTVTSALHFATSNSPKSQKIVIYSDSQNTVDIFNSLHAQPLYNPLLKFAVDTLISGNHKLKVLHISGKLNVCADLLS